MPRSNSPQTGAGRELMNQEDDAIVVGAGHNGLIAGSYLARGGACVLIVEADERIGG